MSFTLCKPFLSKTPNKNIGNVRYYSTSGTSVDMPLALYMDFIEWFRGLVDGEGCFRISSTKINNYSFRFSIGLHIDDKLVLEYIKNKLGFGSIRINKSMAEFAVSSQKDMYKLI